MTLTSLSKLALALFFLQSNLFATTFCFDQRHSDKKIKNVVKDFLHHKDKAVYLVNTHCLDFETSSEARATIMEKALRQKFPDLRMQNKKSATNNYNPLTQAHCKLKLVESFKESSNKNEVDLQKKSKVSSSALAKSARKTHNLYTLEGVPAGLGAFENKVTLLCERKKNFYKITFQLNGIDSSIFTTLNLERGKPQEIGKAISDLDEKGLSLNLSKGLKYEKLEGIKAKIYTLEVE